MALSKEEREQFLAEPHIGALSVSSIEPSTDDQLVEMTKRYLKPEQVDAYLEFARREHGESVTIRLKPEHWVSADLGGF